MVISFYLKLCLYLSLSYVCLGRNACRALGREFVVMRPEQGSTSDLEEPTATPSPPPTMSTRNQVINFQTLRTLVNVDGLYLLGYAWLFGMCMFSPC